MTNVTIPKRYTTAILNSMSAGVVPGIGLEYIHVGRRQEVNAILEDLENIAAGGGAFRVIEGAYGSGKSFMLQLTRNNALQRDYVVADVDLSPERRLVGVKGQGINLYRGLIGRLSTKARPEGNAVETLLQRWIMDVQRAVEERGGPIEGEAHDVAMQAQLEQTARAMRRYVYGEDLARVLMAYWKGVKEEREELRQAALRWIRGEFDRLSDARPLLGVQQIIRDDTWYEFVKLLARLVVQLGYRGLLVLIDEEVNLYKLANRQSRENNYEKLLSIFNDVMQGHAESLGVYLGGTPQSVEDTRRGLFSYEALRSRMQTSRLVRPDVSDFSGPIIRLQPLTLEEIYLLLERLQAVFCAHHGMEPLLTGEQLSAFMTDVSGRLGAEEMLTAREVTRDFITLLNLLRQHPEEHFEHLIRSGRLKVTPAAPDPDQVDENDATLQVFEL